ncbi:hypothetical protein KTD31_01160 [Burkholderia multivorans]|uniref:hypothetical protein n=1 Tax=Burkholderia multivorans TaxID=87883 RepID=UPI001C2481EE|nr:hypothetical protein [Burkholderia multivorans]MBU9200011.1 hypothetical protein [Burkholderia multivorans]
MTSRKPEFAWGAIQGTLTIPQHLRTAAQAGGKAAYEEAEREEFCGDPVIWLPEEPWHAECATLFPAEAVRALGFELDSDGQFRVYSTHGTDPHTDGEGPCFILTLANDGLKFKQGRQSHVTNAGEWYIFDDRLSHTVNASRSSTSYVFLHHALKAVD